MGKSSKRDLYLQKVNATTTTAGEFVTAMENSPYSMHRRHAVNLRLMLNDMSAQAIDDLKFKEESAEFAKKIMAP
jgi:hypothetical protein